MKINEIYQQYGIPPNLARHMMTVAEVVLFIRDHWKDGSKMMNWDILTKSALLHDLGNIVKFDLEKFPEILVREGEDIEYWKRKQQEMWGIYGQDDHEATGKMLIELQIDKQIIQTILNKSFGNSIHTASGDNWYAKILLYSDLRVSPEGVVTLEERFNEARRRLSHYSKRPDFLELLEAVREVERQIQEKVDVLLTDISNRSIRFDPDHFNTMRI